MAQIEPAADRPALPDLIREINLAVSGAAYNGQRRGQAAMNRLTVLYPELANAITEAAVSGRADCDPYFLRDAEQGSGRNAAVWQDFWYAIYRAYGESPF